MSESVNVPVKADDKDVKVAEPVKADEPKGPAPAPKVVSRKPAEVKDIKSVDQTVPGGQYVKAVGRHYVVVDAEGETVHGKMVVESDKGTLEIVNA